MVEGKRQGARVLERAFARRMGLRRDSRGGAPLVQRVSGRDVKNTRGAAGDRVTRARERVARTGHSRMNPRFAE
jgi:hypothetical protein